MRVAAVVGLVGAGLLLAGCGSGDVAGNAAPVDGTAKESVFNPCDDIPDEVVNALAVDLATEERDIIGVKQPGWNVCGWRGSEYSLSVFATTRTLDEVRTNDRNEDFAPVDLDGRSAFTYREVTNVARDSCDVAMGSADGAVLVSIGFHVLTPPSGPNEPCEIAVEAARSISQYVPR
ncbi:DUF3558 domain-containing protein [Prescottella agglutinans]|uniref:DUF3558 domain-containing protein n=1 Tax=Prescottella agglutinans TaxID=1644129 RepID=A0A3S3ATR3_9NOCA|nr:DUF3558 domain-containing protein [Prescottella agglutinans]RVW08243.1 DUF3558 domain-containing protein [Prescottella agglutinans]